MIKVPVETIISKIKDKTGLSEKDIESKIKDKLDILSGLISREGAAHIVANELGVKVFEESGKLEIKNIMPGMRSVEATGKVIKMYETRAFEKENRKGKVKNFLLGDNTGMIRVVAWNDKVDMIENLKENSLVKIENAYSKDNNGRAEIHLGDKSNITVLEEGSIEIKETMQTERKKIKDIKENEDNVEIMGTIVQAQDPRFFEVCPQCGKRAKQKEGEFICEEHKAVTPDYAYVMNLILDDGTETIRIVLWKNQTERLIGKSHEQIVAMKGGSFEDIKNDLLGRIVKLTGRTSRNQMFDRIEFTPALVFIDPDPEEEMKRLKTEIDKAPAESKQDKEHEAEEEIVEKIDITETKKEKKAPKKKEKEEILEEIDDLEDLDSI